MSLKGKVAIVTGSTSGIGLGIAQVLAREGADILLNGLVEKGEGERLRAQLEQEYGVRVGFHPANMAKVGDIEDLVKTAEAKFGHVDILVNNAGIQYVAPVEEFPVEKWDAILAINLTSAFHAIRCTLPKMRERGWGRIVNIASAHGLVASAGKSAYVAAKHGLLGLTKAVALETATTKITCNAVCPGWVLTPLVEKQIQDRATRENISLSEAKQKLLADKQPSLEFATVDQIGATVAFLCSEGAAQIRGASLNVDGGWLAQ